jgi:hypothetical protein
MAKKKARAKRRRGRSPLDMLQPGEAQEVLQALLKAHPELKKEAEAIARSWISDVSSEAVADDVEWELGSLGIDDLNSRAGEHAGGYTGPSEAAWELLQEAIAPIVSEMERQLDLGLERAALETCKGLILGLYAVRERESDGCLGWAPDFAEEAAGDVLRKWHARRKGRRSFPRSFTGRKIPEWSHIVDRVESL